MSSGAKIVNYTKNQFVFQENTEAISYFQLLTGRVKIVSQKKPGREFIHHVSNQGDCLGELFLFLKHQYSVSAIAMEDCRIFILQKSDFDLMLKDYPTILRDLYESIAESLHYTYMMRGFALENPAEKTINLLRYLKVSNASTNPDEVLLTRQEIASLTGLRVETVIRTIKQLENEGLLVITKGKIFY
ncbi:cAMP-binding domain of CRP or a regulatory subunit of cAMP-dependent protein kinases [Chryseobacterium arachidis]|uniref:cAMP-binding domain of CRP or a regulatory subunit of cAMP-dependent protein kinases n=2 Tax=Chryseobacterium arachidis TaxID=1416778 RepID=A0A1M5HP39_9FLAO|nr:cAMP-binding domain of CRP or a regulatory subunit of cAMP-dependent protein kinases [Chryseobacterium arachidis]